MASALERAARAAGEVAIFANHNGVATLSGGLSSDILHEVARAVLMAVRDNPESVKTAWVESTADFDDQPWDIFTAMIDAILNEKGHDQ